MVFRFFLALLFYKSCAVASSLSFKVPQYRKMIEDEPSTLSGHNMENMKKYCDENPMNIISYIDNFPSSTLELQKLYNLLNKLEQNRVCNDLMTRSDFDEQLTIATVQYYRLHGEISSVGLTYLTSMLLSLYDFKITEKLLGPHSLQVSRSSSASTSPCQFLK